MTHPHTLTAIAALSSLRAAYPRLAEAIEGEAHGRRARPRPRHLSAQAAARQDELLREERAEQRAGSRPYGASPAPIRPALLDAQIAAETTVDALCWDLADLLRDADLRPRTPESWHSGPEGRWMVRVLYLATAVRLVEPTHAARAGRQLARADRQVRAALGIGPDLRPLPGGSICPACGEPSLRAEVASEDERDWTVTCTNRCTCLGSQCACRRPDRQPGDPHIWPVEEYAANFGALRRYLLAARAIEHGALTVDGHVWATAEELRRVLAIDLDAHRWQARLQQWRSRGKVQALRHGRANWYRVDQAVSLFIPIAN